MDTDRLKELRDQRGLTQEQLATALGVARLTVLRWENGDTEPPLPMVRRIAEFFKVPAGDLIAAPPQELPLAAGGEG